MNTYLNRKLKKWIELGIIDVTTKNKILKFENETKSPYVLHSIIGLGGFSIVMGIISLIAANWYLISGHIKLTCNYFWLLALAFGIVYANHKKFNLIKEVLILILWGSVLGSIALIGQVYHLHSHLFNAIFLWMALTTPLVLFSKEHIIPHIWGIALIILFLLFLLFLHDEKYFKDSYLFIGSLPLLLFYLSEVFNFYSYNQNFKISVTNFAWLSFGVTVAILGSYNWVTKNLAWQVTPIFIFALSIPIVVLYFKRKQPLIGLLVSFGVLFTELPHIIVHNDLKIWGGVLFITLSAFVALIGIKLKYKKIFDVACLIISIRIIIIYIEVFSTLLKTGIGLIVSGTFILALAYIWHKKRNLIWKLAGEKQ